jgi:hypothetical protein
VSMNQRAGCYLIKKLLNLICDDEVLMNKINLFRCKDNMLSVRKHQTIQQ